MEALVAVGLAGNVTQFIDFSSKVIAEARSLQKNGSSSSLADLEAYVRHSVTQAGIIKSRLDASQCARPLNEEQQHLVDLALETEEAGADFAAFLLSFSSGRTRDALTTKNFLRDLKDGIKIRWRQDKIVSYVDKLEKLRSALMLATQLAVQSRIINNHQDLEFHLNALQITNRNDSTNCVTLAKQAQIALDIVQSDSYSESRLQKKLRQELGMCLLEIRGKHFQTLQNKTILQWLNFRQIQARYEEIDAAYQKTFEWIFERPNANTTWDNFSEHLSNDLVDKPYFINGKAGSGKSTLLRYLVEHEQTHEKLAKWASERRLLKLHYFFWHLGTPLQKAQTGMLRALLHDALKAYPDLIPCVLPSIYNNWQDSYLDEEPTIGELKQAFGIFLNTTSESLKICLTIDGIDELDGNYRDLATFVRSLPRQHVKVIVSSRPINQSISAFRDCPTLRLQDLTQEDMRRYVRGTLGEHESLHQLAKYSPAVAKQLISDIQTKAEGVFLWVRLVVRLLIEGLEAGDSISDLQGKLQSLPGDLKTLYRRMLTSILPEHQVQASEMLQMFHVWNAYTSSQPLGIVHFAFAMQSLDEGFSRPVKPLESDQYIWLYNNTEARIRSRCCGLLEMRRDRGPASALLDWACGDENDGSAVRYIHRTVAEFLTSGDVWSEMCNMTELSGFNPALHLSSACHVMLKSASDVTGASTTRSMVDNLFTLLACSICFHAQHVEKFRSDMSRSIELNLSHLSRLNGANHFFNQDWRQKMQRHIDEAIDKHSKGPLEALQKVQHDTRVFKLTPPNAPWACGPVGHVHTLAGKDNTPKIQDNCYLVGKTQKRSLEADDQESAEKRRRSHPLFYGGLHADKRENLMLTRPGLGLGIRDLQKHEMNGKLNG